MSWNDVIGQENVKLYFQNVLLQNKIASAYCFFGIEGVGKFATALEIIKANSCIQPKFIGGMLEGCNNCINCKDILNLKFPNVEYVFSLPSGKSSDKDEEGSIATLSDLTIEEINSKLKEKLENPYVRFSIRGASQIRINQIRELRKNLALSNAISGRKFVVIFNAEEMRVEAQNAFLKTLEEPRNDVTFFLLTSRREGLLPTILSRCQSIFFPPLTDDDIVSELKKRYPKTETELRMIARFANGSLTSAFELLETNIKDVRDGLVDLLRIALKKDLPGKQLVEKINELTNDLDKKSGQIYLGLLGNWIRDAILLTKNADTNLIINIDDVETLKRFTEKFGTKPLAEVVQLIEKSIYMINSNVQINTVFLNLFLEIREILFNPL